MVYATQNIFWINVPRSGLRILIIDGDFLLVVSRFICFNCGHRDTECKQFSNCGLQGCNELYHELLHKDSRRLNHSISAAKRIVKFNDDRKIVGLDIIAVYFIGLMGKQRTYALLDNGADSTSICQRLARKSSVTGNDTTVWVESLNSILTENSLKVSFIIELLDVHIHVTVDKAFMTTKINLSCGYSLTSDQLKGWKHSYVVELKNVGRLEIEIIISCDALEAHYSIDQRVHNRNQPFSVKTVLG